MSVRVPLPIAGLAIGATFFLVIAGPRIVDPGDVDWTMQLDWRIHFLGWHIFRGEPWSWPPGALVGYHHAPSGTSIGYTDSIPLVAIPLKIASGWLPMPMQYLGVWLLACFALQGLFGALLATLWTRSAAATLGAASLFVLMPTLLNRAPHPALCAHWTLLWALWLYFGWAPGRPLPIRHTLLLTAIVSLIHPYIAVMVMAILAALFCRSFVDRAGPSPGRAPVTAMAVGTGALAVLLVGWWASGLFVVTGPSMARPGFHFFSMNLLGPITPLGWSSLLPEVPVGAGGQTFEGFQYLGAGVLGVTAIGIVAAARTLRFPLRALGPIGAACGVMALYSLSPRITLADRVLVDMSSPELERYAVFGVTGRFFWPAAYLLLTLAVASVARALPGRPAAIVLILAVGVQLVDLRPGHAERRALTRSAAFHEWPDRPRSAVWARALPHYRHLVLVLPPHCGPSPVGFELPGYLAGLHGLTMNAGEVARVDEALRRAYCERLQQAVGRGEVHDDEFYLVHPAFLDAFRRAAPSLVCGVVDGLHGCVTSRSYQRWRDRAAFE